jgi:hypothetical protein
MTDLAERAALKDLMQNIDTTVESFHYVPTFGFGGTIIMPEEFIADDSIDPCTNNGQGKRLLYVTCIQGHVVSLSFDWFNSPTFTAFPTTISHLTQLRHVSGAGRNTGEWP